MSTSKSDQFSDRLASKIKETPIKTKKNLNRDKKDRTSNKPVKPAKSRQKTQNIPPDKIEKLPDSSQEDQDSWNLISVETPSNLLKINRDLYAERMNNRILQDKPAEVIDLVNILDQKRRLKKLQASLPGRYLADDIEVHARGDRRLLRRGESLWVLSTNVGDIISEHILINPELMLHIGIIEGYLLDLRYLPFLPSGYMFEHQVSEEGIENFLISPQDKRELVEYFGLDTSGKGLMYPEYWCLTKRVSLSNKTKSAETPSDPA